ncbi:hypothetical protein AAEX28_07195 [Lentisphaerota bacterium WC36G]|nr:hypothetical protein LJT99_10060 [Lentisphaerae bacterium WC36]UDQ99303.1 hypothetical protein LJT99_07135 [Lentisphaerae bacterium WC36]
MSVEDILSGLAECFEWFEQLELNFICVGGYFNKFNIQKLLEGKIIILDPVYCEKILSPKVYEMVSYSPRLGNFRVKVRKVNPESRTAECLILGRSESVRIDLDLIPIRVQKEVAE